MADGESRQAEHATPASDAAPAGPTKVKRLAPYLAGTLLSIGLGVTAAIVTAPAEPDAPVLREDDVRKVSPLDEFGEAQQMALPPIVANLADEGQMVAGKFLIHLEVRLPPEAKFDELQASCCDKAGGKLYAKVRDALVMLFSGKVSGDLRTPHGKEILKLEILDLLGPVVFDDPGQGALTNVYFEDFLIQ
jgi:flagellar basal body-associated protein FliL